MTVRLRPLTDVDLPLLTGEDAPYDTFGPPQGARQSAPATDLNQPGGFGIILDDALVGDISWIWQQWGPNQQSRNPMIGIWLSAGARGRGIGSEAQRQMADLFFRHTTVNRVEAHTHVDNMAEQRALEKAGFTREGTTRGAQWRDGAYHDGYLYSILREDWA